MSRFNAINEKIGHYRWVICALLFFATTINYLDRAIIGLLKENLTEIFHWTESDYSNIVISFQMAYAVSLLFAGWVMDRIGTRLGYGFSLFMWSVAAILHGFVRGTGGFVAVRALLGVGESGNFPAANKTVAEWFPKKERALATGIYNSGSNIGAIVAPLLVPWIAINWGWQWAFVATGAIGFVWIVFWWMCYDSPDRHKKLTKPERRYINSDVDGQIETVDVNAGEKVSWGRLLCYRQTWAFVVGKFFSDPVWWFFLFWLPAFLKSEYKLEGMQISMPLIVVYIISAIGSVFGGWLPKRLIDRGHDASYARKVSMFIYALLPLFVLFAQSLGRIDMWLAIIVIALACAAHCAWMANLFATVSDMFPMKAVASVTGIGGMAGSMGGILMAWAAGILFDHYKLMNSIHIGYGIMFIFCALSYLMAWLVMHVLVPKYGKIEKL